MNKECLVEPVSAPDPDIPPIYWIPRTPTIPIPQAALFWNQRPDLLRRFEDKLRITRGRLACYQVVTMFNDRIKLAIDRDRFMSNHFSINAAAVSFRDPIVGQSGQVVSMLSCNTDLSCLILDFAQYLYGITSPVFALGRNPLEAVSVMQGVYQQELDNPMIQMSLIPSSLEMYRSI